jgi:hypothetical protein
MNQRIEDLLAITNEYKEWMESYETLRKRIKDMSNFYIKEITEHPEGVTAKELMLAINIMDTTKSFGFTRDDYNTRLGDLKSWINDDYERIICNLKDIVNSRCKEELGLTETKEDEYI